MLPHLTEEPPWFTFLMHPRDKDDLFRMGASSFVRRYSTDDDDFVGKVTTMPALAVGEFTFGFGPVRGELVAVMRMPEHMLGPVGREGVLDAVKVAVQRGSAVVGLGALTAPATGGGAALLKHIPPSITLTNGNAYTAAVARSNVIAASESLNLGRNARVAILGCTGSVGCAASRLLTAEGYELILIGRAAEVVKHFLGDLPAEFSGEVADVRKAQVVLVLTSDHSARLEPGMFEPGTVVIDVAQPRNIPTERVEEFWRHGVRVAEGGLVRIPGYVTTYDLRLVNSKATFACLAETYLFSREGIRDHSVGRPTPEQSLRMEAIAARYGVKPEPLHLDAPAVPTGSPLQ